jgi:uncharacterized protein
VAASFLRTLLSAPPGAGCQLVNARTGLVLASVVETAVDSATRRRGLLGRDSLPPGHALVIAPCPAIHTFFMRFPIDVVFASRDGRVLGVRRNVRPWRIAFASRAFAAIEWSAGSIAPADVRVGDTLTCAITASR